MQLTIDQHPKNPFSDSIEPLREMAAYEALWEGTKIGYKYLAEVFASRPGSKPSDLVNKDRLDFFLTFIKSKLQERSPALRPNVIINNTYDYPRRLRDAIEPVELLYYLGDLSLLTNRSVAVVGSRKPSAEGLARTEKLVKLLLKDNFTIVSGLAEGIDTKAHETAIENEGKTISVIGTPITEYYPKKNKDLQDRIAREFLLISQVPIWRYSVQNPSSNKFFFPERNKTMSALTEATIIVEASDTSGTLGQARAALNQGRKLFILESCFQRQDISWPRRFENMGAIRVRDYSDIQRSLLNERIHPTED